MSKLGTILDQIDSGTVLLPEFQRGYVWNRDQIRGLMRSLYRGYPVGSLLVWETEADPGAVRGDSLRASGIRLLLLDGQQRITTLYGIIRGRPPAFFDGNPELFRGLRFHVDDEVFEFYAPAKMKDDRRWVDVTALFAPNGLEEQIKLLRDDPEIGDRLIEYMTRLNRLRTLLEREFLQDKITGSDKSVDVVVDIFNRVNSGGTKLSKGDLALAKICAGSPEVRGRMRNYLGRWEDAGYSFTLDWLLRVTNALLTGRAVFSALDGVPAQQFGDGLASAAKRIGTLLDTVQGRLGLDHDRVLMGRYAFPVAARYLEQRGGRFVDAAERDRLLFWYVHAALWGRFAGSTESVLTQDLETLDRHGVDGLIGSLERWRGGNLTLGPYDFAGSTTGSRFYPLLYLLTRVLAARDLGTGNPLRADMLGPLSSLQVHHIFPKAVLYEYGYSRGEVNSVANYCFLTQDTNLRIGRREPAEYMAATESRYPGDLASQWIPRDPALWQPERYLDFLAARQHLLADAANTFLSGLRSPGVTQSPDLPRATAAVPEVEPDPRTNEINAVVAELAALGFVSPTLDAEISDPADGRVLAIAEAVWSEGLQPGQGSPVVLELDPGDADLPRLQELGYEVFTSTTALAGYARHRSLEAAGLIEATQSDR
jgi:hypothetical protein